MEENREIATPEEVLAALTAILRGEDRERFKAAELLGKHYGLFAPQEEAPAMSGETAAALEEAIRSLPS